MKLTVNGAERDVAAPPDMPLLWVLLGLTGTKFGCGGVKFGRRPTTRTPWRPTSPARHRSKAGRIWAREPTLR